MLLYVGVKYHEAAGVCCSSSCKSLSSSISIISRTISGIAEEALVFRALVEIVAAASTEEIEAVALVVVEALVLQY